MGDISFLPDDYLAKRAQRRTNVTSLTLFIVVMGAVVAAFFVTDKQRKEVRALQIQVNGRYEEAAKRLDQLDQLHDRKNQMIRKAKMTKRLVQRVPRSVVLAELINTMPGTLNLLEFTLETRVLRTRRSPAKTALGAAKKKLNTPEPEIIPDVIVTIVGVASTDIQVAQYMASLDRSDLFQELNLMYSEETKIEANKMRKFRIDMKLDQQVDMQDYEPRLVQRKLKQNPMSNKIEIQAPAPILPARDIIKDRSNAGD